MMTLEDAVALVKQMEYYEAHSHLGGYDKMLDEFLQAMLSDPITLSRAIRIEKEKARADETDGT